MSSCLVFRRNHVIIEFSIRVAIIRRWKAIELFLLTALLIIRVFLIFLDVFDPKGR